MPAGKGLVIVGIQFGDEGKGKITDYYTSKPWIHAVVRFNGGANAGHTIITPDGTKYALHLLPSGMVFEKPSFIGNGVVIDLEKVQEELNQLEQKKGKDISHLLKISNRAHLVLPHHIALDTFQENIKAQYSMSAGTTKRGIGPAYHDKISRFGIRFGDLWDDERLSAQLDFLAEYYQPFSTSLPVMNNFNDLKKTLKEMREKFSSFIVDSGIELYGLLQQGKNVLFEGAQATLLDIDHGLYPFGTSSTCVVAGASSGSGVGVNFLNERLGVVKAYCSRVGTGPLMGELDTSVDPGKTIQTDGYEFGTTTGRPRRIAWLDLVALKYACRVNGLTGLAITKLDILGLIDKISIVTGYQHNETGVISQVFPSKIADFQQLKPVTQEFSGWGKINSEDWEVMCNSGWTNFPAELKDYIMFIEQETSVPVIIIGVGAKRTATFERYDLEKKFII